MTRDTGRFLCQCYNVTSAPVQCLIELAQPSVARRDCRRRVARSMHFAGAPYEIPCSAMSERKARVVTVGEAIVELVRGGDGRFGIGCAGDTFNVAVYLARAGLDVAFATALGDDPYSDASLALAAAEGVASDLVLRLRGGLPGLAVVDSGADGTRHHHDWRGESPARELFELPDWGAWPRVSLRQSSSISPDG